MENFQKMLDAFDGILPPGAKQFLRSDSAHPFQQEVIMLALEADVNPHTAREKYKELKLKLEKTAFCTTSQCDNCGASPVLAMQSLAALARRFEDIETAKKYLKMSIDYFPDGPKTAEVEIFLLDAHMEMCSLLEKEKNTNQYKKHLKRSYELYSSVKLKNDVPVSTLRASHLQLISSYMNYYTLLNDLDKIKHNGILLLQYELSYDIYQGLHWRLRALEMSKLCCKLGEYGQSHYLIRASEVIDDPITKKTTVAGMTQIYIANHCFALLEATKGESLALKETEVKTFKQLDVPPGNPKLDKPPTAKVDIQFVFKAANESMKKAKKHLTKALLEDNNFEDLVLKQQDIRRTFPDLV